MQVHASAFVLHVLAQIGTAYFRSCCLMVIQKSHIVWVVLLCYPAVKCVGNRRLGVYGNFELKSC